jgi:Smg protein
MPIRVLGPHERGRFAPEAWGHLLSLTGAGLLTGGELEHVIERALTHIDGRIALDDLRSLMEGGAYDDSLTPSPGGGVSIH